MKPIADTGLLVGFLDASDQYHAWAVECFGGLRTALSTCEAVIAETEYLVPGSGPLLMEMVARGTLRIVPMLPAETGALSALMKRYRKMQFADACIVRLSESLADAIVYTNLPKLLDFNHRSHGWAQMDETCRTSELSVKSVVKDSGP